MSRRYQWSVDLKAHIKDEEGLKQRKQAEGRQRRATIWDRVTTKDHSLYRAK